MRIKNPHSCFICSRRSDGLAVGKPDKLAWFCEECGIKLAKEAYSMPKEFDIFEDRALARIAAKLPPTDFNFPASELPAFLKWMIDDFGEEIRKEIESGKAPF
jgi:ribosomal protein L37AE/L43A